MPENNQILSVEGQLVGMPLAGPESFTAEQIAYLKRAMGIDETVLFSGTAYGQTAIQLSESLLNFDRVKIWMRSKVDASNPVSIVEYPTSTITDTLNIFLTDSNAYGGSQSSNNWGAGANVHNQEIYKIVGIHRISGGNE